MAKPVYHVSAASLAFCLLVLSGLVYPQMVPHAAHHAHHQATTHATALCAWLCAAGQALETSDVGVGSEPGPSAVLLSAHPEQHPLVVRWASSSRGPPTVVS